MKSSSRRSYGIKEEELVAEHTSIMRIIRKTTEIPFIFFAIFELKEHFLFNSLVYFFARAFGSVTLLRASAGFNAPTQFLIAFLCRDVSFGDACHKVQITFVYGVFR